MMDYLRIDTYYVFDFIIDLSRERMLLSAEDIGNMDRSLGYRIIEVVLEAGDEGDKWIHCCLGDK